MTQEYEAPIVIEPPGPARACVLWLHGLGADGHDFEPIVPELALPEELGVRFVFPHAPMRPVTLNGGYVMRAWFDLRAQDLAWSPDLEGIAESAAYLERLMEEQLADGIAPQRLILAGFSQGGVVALETALGLTVKPGGVMALSTWLARPAGSGEGLQIFQAHGEMDPVVPLSAALEARTELEALGAKVEWHSYPMAHTVHPAEIRDMAGWLRRRLT
ncbi:MAG: carboxylesterase [Gammaproteobacteria bacterium]|nr:MAG: carboxylesterase [Gammaproteobacteria bacterium]